MDILSSLSKAFTDIVLKNPHLINVLIFICSMTLFVYVLKVIFRNRSTNFKYQSLGRLFSDAEHFFFLILKQSLRNEYQIFAKVRIADILAPDKDLSQRNWKSAFYKITSKHFDYVLCDKDTLAIVAVIELDDKTHELSKIRSRDIFVEKACETAGLKLLRFPCRSHYDVQEVRKKIINSLNLSLKVKRFL
ncbi:MAG: DUF2726 domain-containing protein [Nitrosomonas sp.]|nr:DUF2726 domain-containing protein [Nitrosomonas sp.]